LSMGSLELLLRVSVFTVLDPSGMGGTTLPNAAVSVRKTSMHCLSVVTSKSEIYRFDKYSDYRSLINDDLLSLR